MNTLQKKQIDEMVTPDAKTIASFTGTRADAVQVFIDSNRLDASALAKFVEKGRYPERAAVIAAISGKPGNRYQKDIINRFQLNESNTLNLKQIIQEEVRKQLASSISKSRPTLQEVKIPSHIQTWAERHGVEDAVYKIAGWAAASGQKIVGGTAIGKDYSTLILDLTYQGSEISFDTETGKIELYGERVRSSQEFQEVFDAAQEDSDDDY